MALLLQPLPLDELHAVVLQTTVTVGLAALCWSLYRVYRKPVFAWWTAAWALYVLRLVAIGIVVVDPPVPGASLATVGWTALYWHQVITGWTALAVLATAFAFSHRLRWRRWFVLPLLFPPLWSYVAVYRIDSFLLAAGPAVLFLSGATLWTGVVFLRYARHARSPGARFLGVAFALWGLHHLDYPFLRARGAWTPWGYYLDILFIVAVGAGILLLVADDLRRGARALTTLSSAWEGAASMSSAEFLAGVLDRAASLPAVHGAALFRADQAAYEQGAGACASWTGARPTGEEAGHLRRAVERGEAVVAPRWEAPSAPGVAPSRLPYAAVIPVPAGDGETRALVIIAEDHEPFAALDAWYLTALGRQAGGALAYAGLVDALRRRTDDLERISARMVVQHEEERRRLSRELHDETAQLLSALKMELGVLRDAVPGAQAVRVDDALALTDAGIRSIRAAIRDLRPSLLDDLGLLAALRSVVTAFEQRSAMAVHVSLAPQQPLPPLAPEAELAFFRAMQEALSNVARHAEARTVWVTLDVGGGRVTLTVRDDGRGLRGPQTGQRGTGVAGMHERFARLGGRVSLGEATGGGACLEASLPIPADDGVGFIGTSTLAVAGTDTRH
jgi:signal transduction histidine kinase